MSELISDLRKQTGADKIYLLERRGKTIILPVREGINFASQKYTHLPSTNDFVLSNLAMSDEFIPGLTDYLQKKGIVPDVIKGITGRLFEDIRYLGFSWHRHRVQVLNDYRNKELWVLSTGKKNSFYGSDYGGNVISVITKLDDLLN